METFLSSLLVPLALAGPLLLPVLLAWPAARRHERFFQVLGRTIAGIYVPLAVFFLSVFMIPEAKDWCEFGWLDCFHLGKLALTPFVLWACAAHYVYHIWNLDDPPPPRPWITLGLFAGSLVSGGCAILGLIVHDWGHDTTLFLAVPLYVSVSFGCQCHECLSRTGSSLIGIAYTASASLPLWVIGAAISKKHYESLPATVDSGCFIVTAAQQGHPALVGPFSEVQRRGLARFANRQLQTFWELEDIWKARSPRTHQFFRRFYNRVGPWLAKRLNSRLRADIVFIALKPAEFLARRITSKRHR